MNKIKKLLLLCLALLPTVILAAACSGGADTTAAPEPPAVTTSATTAATTSATTTLPEYVATVAPEHIGVREQLSALPTATPDMSTDELRQLCVDFVRLQASFLWTPDRDYKYPYKAEKDTGELKYIELTGGDVYAGLPYTHSGSNLYAFLDYYYDSVGVAKFDDNIYPQQKIGNNCAQALFWGWARVSTSIGMVPTRYMNSHNGYVKLGRYALAQSITDFHPYNTRDFCKNNGIDVMCESYALLRMADGLVLYNDAAGHTLMASIDAVTVRDAGGKIDPDQSYITVLDQSSRSAPKTLSDGTVYYGIGGVDLKFTFRDLYKKGYLPFTVAELIGEREVASPTFEFDCEEGATVGYDELNSSWLRSNYALVKIFITLTDADGKTVCEIVKYPTKKNIFAQPMQSNLKPLRELSDGRYSVEIRALISNGETLNAWSGFFEK